jgi:hypothetical protein
MGRDADHGHQDGGYRDGLSALLAEHEARRLRVAERARPLDAFARRELLPALARELTAAEEALARPPTTRAELDAAAQTLDEHERQVEIALAALDEGRERAAADLGHRRNLVVAAITAFALLVVAYVFLRDVPAQLALRREAHFYARCPTSLACRDGGLCSPPPPGVRPSPPTCWALRDEDCLRSRDCAEYGRCIAVDGSCRTLTDARCRASRGCSTLGACAVVNGRCGAANDVDCAGSERCLEDGACTAAEGRCQASRQQDCAASAGCRKRGACWWVKGECAGARGE